MSGSILVHGSLAFDLFFYYPASIRDHILRESERLSVNIRAAGPEKLFGGCAGNVAHTVNLFHAPVSLSSWAGNDAGYYLRAFKERGIDVSRVCIDPVNATPSAVLLKDDEENQWIIFGEPEKPVRWELPDFDTDHPGKPTLAVLTSGMPERNVDLIRHLISAGIPYIIDPGKMISDMPPQDLVFCIDYASCLILNGYELQLLAKTTGLAEDEVISRAGRAVVTQGRNGCELFRRREHTKSELQQQNPVHVAAVLDIAVSDSYGAGDAFLGGFSAAVFRGADAAGAARAGTIAASFAVEHRGTQNHVFSAEQFVNRYRNCFGEPKVPLFG
jgi:adenosine kinase